MYSQGRARAAMSTVASSLRPAAASFCSVLSMRRCNSSPACSKLYLAPRTCNCAAYVYMRFILHLCGSSGPTGYPRKRRASHETLSPGKERRERQCTDVLRNWYSGKFPRHDDKDHDDYVSAFRALEGVLDMGNSGRDLRVVTELRWRVVAIWDASHLNR